MSKVSLHYNETIPSDKTRLLVSSYIEFCIESDSSQPVPHEVFPDGCVSLIYRRNRKLSVEMLLVKGLSLETFYTQVFDGDIHWGVKFSPAVCALIMRCDPKTILTEPLSKENDFPHLTAGILDNLNKCSSFEEAIAVFENTLQNLKIESNEIDEKICRTVEIIEKQDGDIKVAEIAEAINLSTRQLERRFRKNTGLTPKQFIRIRRIRATAIHLVQESQMNWANRAAEIGFTDQSHLTHEFSTLTGRTPNSFAKNVKKIKYGDLVK